MTGKTPRNAMFERSVVRLMRWLVGLALPRYHLAKNPVRRKGAKAQRSLPFEESRKGAENAR